MNWVQQWGIVLLQKKFKVLTLLSKKKAAKHAFRLFCTPFAKPTRKVLPKNAEPLQFQLDGITIRGNRWNYPKANKLLILHGFSSAAYKFDSYMELFIKKDYEVISFDAPAHGQSGGKTTNVLQYAEMIKKAITLYGPINKFVAHSFGGIALSLAMENMPQQQNTKIAFIAPATETISAINNAFALLKIKDKKVRAAFDKIIFTISGKLPQWFSMRRAVKNITAKILWIHDEDDDITPLSDAIKVKEDGHPNINFIITKGLGHRKIYNDKAVKKAIENFL